MAKVYMHVVTVRARGNVSMSFPIDMLRYDRLSPNGEGDSGKIAQTFHLGRKTDEVGNIELQRVAPKNWAPTNARWQSFVWEVVDHQIRGAY
jgi:hypothetical protein